MILLLKEEALTDYTSASIIDDAKELYYAGNVGRVTMARGNYDVIEISSNVKDARGYSLFAPSIWLSPDGDKIIDFSCSCQEATDSTNMCEHACAVVLKIMYEQLEFPKKEYIQSDEVTTSEVTGVTGWRRGSDDEIKEFLDTYASVQENTLPALQKNSTIEVLPEIVFEENHEVTIRLRIGKVDSRKYLIRHIVSFVETCKNESFFSYGKNLEFIHKEDVFTQESLKLINFLKEIDNLANAIYPLDMDTNLWFGLNDTLPLKGPLLDRFIEQVSIQTENAIYLNVATQYSVEQIEFKKEMPCLGLEMSSMHDGYVLEHNPFKYYEGDKNLYIKVDQDPMYYIVEKKDPLIAPFLDLLQSLQGEPQFVASVDFPLFAKRVYPSLIKSVPIKCKDLDVKEYLPDHPNFEVYLDTPAKDVISCKVMVLYDGYEPYNLFETNEESFMHRNQIDEAGFDAFISPWFNDFDPTDHELILKDQEDLLFDFMNSGIAEIKKKAKVFISENMKAIKIRNFDNFGLGIRLQSNLLELDINSSFSREELAEIISHYDNKKKYFRLKTGEFIQSTSDLDEMVQLTQDLQLTKKQLKQEHIYIPTYRALAVDEFVKNHDNFDSTIDTHFETLVDRMEELGNKTYPVPKPMDTILRGYQKKGYSWLCSLRDAGFCGLLADEMGLGKTIQIISLILGWENRGRVLIVSPASLVYNWANEFKLFADHLPIKIIAGTAKEREDLIKNSGDDEILITSYDLLKRDINNYLQLEFCCEIIDEAQFIKNPKTKAARAVKGINSSFRVALTGTPIENRLSELWSIFDYLMPGYLYTYKTFQNEFEYPITLLNDDEAQDRLKQMITPFTLRRLKKDVLKDLPEKLEEVVYAPLEGEQEGIYAARVQALMESLENDTNEEFNKHKIEILAEITKLREICCSPALLYKNYKQNSAKEEVCMELIRRAVNSGHKVLLFSQFTSMLNILVERLKEEGIKYYMLTGSTPKKERMDLVNAFQSDETPVFAISLKAGGTGLNLTAADIVIHYDPWWNTAAENQASDRAHRIGQESIVTVYRLILKDSIEEKILNLQQEKASLATGVLSDENISSTKLTKEDLLKLL